MKFIFSCLVFAACVAVAYSRDIYVNTSSQLDNVMKVVQPGDHVYVLPGKYQITGQAYLPWTISASGTESKPIIMSCSEYGLCGMADSIVVSNSAYLTIAGFSIGVSSSFDAVTLQDSSYITLDTLQLHYGDDNNLYLLRSSNCDVKYCSFDTTKKGITLKQSSGCTVKHCTFGKNLDDLVLYIENSTKCEFSANEVYASQTSYGGGSWIVEVNAGGNMISDNDFGFSFSKYQKPLNGYLAKGDCLYGPTTLENNFMDLKSGTGFAGCKDYNNRVCASNVVAGGATFTDGTIDSTC